MAATLPALTRPPEIFFTRRFTTSEATRTPCREKEWYGGEQRPETPGRDRGGVWAMLLLATPAMAIDHEALWALLQRGGRWSSPAMPRRSQVGRPPVPPRRVPDAAQPVRRRPGAGPPPWAAAGMGAHCAGALVGGVAAWRPPAWRLARSSPGGPSFAFPGPPPRGGADDLVRQRVGERPMTGNLILVTHQVNITALTGIAPAAGEMVILTPQGDSTFRLAGRCPPLRL